MSIAVARSSGGYSVPTSQNTAPVIEFACLFTHDLKRKQKRWQDGVLRFHTFNRRIMIYDTQGSYIGDKHWKQDDDPEEGGELRLDKGALVEIGEQKSTTETDISGLFQRKNKSTPDDAGPESPRPRPPLATRNAVSVNTPQPKHKSLGALLGARQGAYGRAAIPIKSPYQIRQEERENETPTEERGVKRQRLDANVELAKKPLSLWAKTSDALTTVRPQAKTATASKRRIDLDLTSDEPRSDVTVPPTPPSDSAVPPRSAISRPQVTNRPATEVNTSLQAAQRREAARPVEQLDATSKPAAILEAHTRRAEKSRLQPSGFSAKLAEAADTIESFCSAASVHKSAPAEAAKQSSPPIRDPAMKKPTQSRALRIVKAPPRRMLMCLDEPILRKSQMAIDLDNLAEGDTAVRSEEKASSEKPQRKQDTHQPVEPKKKAKRRSLLDIEDELDAQEHGEGLPASAEAGPAPIRKLVVANATRTPLSRTTSVTVTTRVPAIEQNESFVKPQRRSPLKKAKSMSTTDAGNDTVAKKSRSSKSAVTTATKSKTAVEPVQILKSTAVEPWSVEAFDLFAWRPPEKAALHEAVSVA